MTISLTLNPRPVRLFWAAALALTLRPAPRAGADDADAPKPIRALLVTGGGYHDYDNQKTILTEGISTRARVEWTILHEKGTGNGYKISIYENPDWAAKYDVIVHNECFADVEDKGFIEKVLAPHRAGTPALVVHCTMHTFRALKSDEWREFLGVDTRGHGPQHPLEIKNLKPDHAVMKGFPAEWVTGNEELYAINKLFPTAEALAEAPERGKQHTCIWTNTYGKGRVFGTTVGHNNKTMNDPIYLDLITRGLLWSVGKLDDNGQPKAGYATSKAK